MNNDSGSTFIPVRVHPGSHVWLCICLRDTSTKSRTSTTSHTGARSPRLTYWIENFDQYHVKAVRPLVSV